MFGKSRDIFSIFLLLNIFFCACVRSDTNATDESNLSSMSPTETTKIVITESPIKNETLDPIAQSKAFEKIVKTNVKNVIKRIMPELMKQQPGEGFSSSCTKGLLKYIGALTAGKSWAYKMLDATSKPPSGIFEGTFASFGSFDECLDILVQTKKGIEEFRGSYCSVEARPLLLPRRRNFSLSHIQYTKSDDTIAKEVLVGGSYFYFSQFRLGVCVPSVCSAKDIQTIADNIGKLVKFHVKIPKCYVKENIKWEIIHIAMIIVLAFLLLLVIIGTIIDLKKEEKQNNMKKILISFSISKNYKKLISPSEGLGEMKALHGIRALSIAWVILGHTYVWTNFQLVSRPRNFQNYFHHLSFEAILNAWLSVESFFFLSGLLTCYGCMQLMVKTKGHIHVPFFILRRYIRLAPTFLLVMGFVFFLPIISSGPFWYEKIDQEIESCRTYWWTNLLLINNWFPMTKICMHPTWYIAADFQLHILSLFILFPLYKSKYLGFISLAIIVLAGTIAVGVITYILDLPPIILITSGYEKLISDTVNFVHIRTYTHIGPYCIGMLTGYLILKCKDVKISKGLYIVLWLMSITFSIASLYGVHKWSIGEPHGPILTCVYAALHRTIYIAGIAWVAFACVTGRGGIINSFLSFPLFVPLSRLTFTTYLIQSLVIWTRKASERERVYASHYNVIYEWIANWAISVFLAVPLNLLIEAPVANLDRFIFSKNLKEENEVEKMENSKNQNIMESTKELGTKKTLGGVELKSVIALYPDTLNRTSINGNIIK